MAQPWKHPKSGVYYFRRQVPPDIRTLVGRTEWKRSLKTRDISLARPRFAAESAKCEELFTAARSQLAGQQKVLASDAPKLADRWAKRTLQAWETGEADPKEFLGRSGPEYDPDGNPVAGSEIITNVDVIDCSDPREQARVAFPHIQQTLLAERLPIPDSRDLAYKSLVDAFFVRWREVSEIARERYFNNWRATLTLPEATKPLSSEQEKAELQAVSPQLSSVLESWAEDKKLTDGENRSTTKTISEFSTTITRFIELQGDLPVARISRSTVQEFRASLGKLPTRGTGLKGLTAPELIARAEAEGLPTISLGTLKKHLKALSTILNFACHRLGVIQEDPVSASGIIRQISKAAQRSPLRQDEDKAYTWSELMTIFKSPAFTQGWKPARADYGEAFYWLPLLFVYTGARREELAQLLVHDVVQDEHTGIWYLSIRNGDDQVLKTGNSRRKVPLHDDLIRLGFLDYTAKLPQDGRLFPKLTVHPVEGYGHNFGKLWAKYLKEVAHLDSKASPAHGFRHTFKTLCRQSSIDEYVHDWITGHAPANVGGTYGTNPLTRMAKELEKYPSIATEAGLIKETAAA